MAENPDNQTALKCRLDQYPPMQGHTCMYGIAPMKLNPFYLQIYLNV